MSQVGALQRPEARKRGRGGTFFVVMAAILLVIVLVGFARSFYLKPFLGLAEMAMHPYVHGGILATHGAVLTAWFCLLATQVLLVRHGRTRVHRRVGLYGTILAVAVVATSLLTLAHREAPFIDEAPFRSLGNLMSVIGFSLCIPVGVRFRHRPEVHKRLLLLGSVLITGPALSRMARIPALAELLDPVSGHVFATVTTLSLMLAVVGYDFVTRRRPHPATVGGLLGIFVLAPAISAALMYGGVWRTFVRLVT